MNSKQTSLVLIGYQNDYFSNDGILHEMIEDSSQVEAVLTNTISLIDRLKSSDVLIVSTPIIFTPDYSEILDPVGILKSIKEMGAFKAGNEGSETVTELSKFGDRILVVPGKRGLNAFSNTKLKNLFEERGIINVILAGVVTSLCIDSTGRAAYEYGYKVSILSDCTSGRTDTEQKFYCETIFPLYAEITDSNKFMNSLGAEL